MLPGEDLSQEDVDPGRVRESACTVLTDVLGWRTISRHWERIVGLVAAVERAVAEGDLVALADATAELELEVPVRSNRIERPPHERRGMNEDLRERINRLQHSLGSADGVEEKEDPDDRPGRGDR